MIAEKIIDLNIKYPSFKERGIAYYCENKVNITNVNYLSSFDSIEIKFKSGNYMGYFIFDGKTIYKENCSCKAFQEYEGSCKHLIASFYKYNEYCIIEEDVNVNSIENLKLCFGLSTFTETLYISPYVKINHKFFPLDAAKFLENIYEIDYYGKIINLNNLNENHAKFNSDIINFLNIQATKETNYHNEIVLNNELFDAFYKYHLNNDIPLIYKNDNKPIKFIMNDVENHFVKSFFEDYTIKFKKDFSGYINIKTDIDIKDYGKVSNISFILFSSENKEYNLIYSYPIELFNQINVFYEQYNYQIKKENFPEFYKLQKLLISQFNPQIATDFITKNNLLNQDPILDVSLEYNEELDNPVVKLSYKYGEVSFNVLDNNKTDLVERKFDLEKKLYDSVKKHLGEYIDTHNCFIFDEEKQFNNFLIFVSKKKDSKNYLIKVSKKLIYKPKVKAKFFVSSVNADIDYLDVNWSLEGYTDAEARQILNAYVKKQEFIILSNNKKININKTVDFEGLESELEILNTSIKDIDGLSIKTPKWNVYYLKRYFKDKDNLNKFFEDLNALNNVELKADEELVKMLKPYQYEGYKWLKKHYNLKTGSILADEMGLGKTLQTITLLNDLYYSSDYKKVSLIVAPSSLIYNWYNEINKFSPVLKTGVLDGNAQSRREILKKINDYDVLITSYNMLKIDLEFYRYHKFHLIVIDEGHLIKNHFTKYSKAIKSLTAEHKIALTGTPMENNVLELWSLFDFIMPGFLNDFGSFKNKYGKGVNDQLLEDLKEKIHAFILRRTKKDVLKDLPEKNERLISVELDEEQKEIYYSTLQKGKEKIKVLYDTQPKSDQNRFYVFSLLTDLRQICCSPKLVYENARSNGSKFEMCINLVKDILERNEKVLIFSQFKNMINIISEYLVANQMEHFIITGDTNKKLRQDLVDQFNGSNTVKIFLITLKAGGVGLNLSTANNVIHFDPWWNVSAENQASDRAHRIGQEQNVNIFKLITKDTIEEKIINLQNLKKDIIDNVLNLNMKNIESIPIDEIFNILGLDYELYRK